MLIIAGDYLLWFLVCGAAIWRGGALRIAGWAIIIAIIDTPLWRNRHPPIDLQTGILTVDVALTVVLVGLYLEARHRWLLFAAAFQLLETLTHLARILDGRIHARSYETTMLIWSFGYLGAVLVGVITTKKDIGSAKTDRQNDRRRNQNARRFG